MRSPAVWATSLSSLTLAIVPLMATPACRPAKGTDGQARDRPAGVALVPGGMSAGIPHNRFAYIPPQCYTMTRDGPGAPARNPCYACHVRAIPPNFVEDSDLQLAFTLPPAAARNPWRNLFAPPWLRAPRRSDADVLAYVRRGNYFDGDGSIALAGRLSRLPVEWDGQRDGHWDGYVPDAWFRFDPRGFDHAPDGRRTGWRAFAYAPLPGGFLPSNGSADDVLIRLDRVLQEDAGGRLDESVYEANLAIVEALVSRADVAVDPVDETSLGVDLDLDGVLGRASRVAFRAPRVGQPAMHYAGRARGLENDAARPFRPEPGLFPLGTEFLHSVRYLDVDGRGEVTMAARMKELRYAKKVRWLSPAELAARAAREATEQAESADGALEVLWQLDRGVYNGQGWLLQGFIEGADGALRPQSYEESLPCAGCHGEIGATTDSMFAFARKLGGDAPARGWFHWTQHGLRGLREPRRRDGRYEYTLYLTANGGGDDLGENREIEARFFDAAGRLRGDAVSRLHADISTLLLPSAPRALDLDRATWAIVREQSFVSGRDAVLAPSRRVHDRAPVGEKTGVVTSLRGPADPSPLPSPSPN